MASGLKVEVKGLQELGQTFRYLADPVANQRVCQKAVNAAAQVISKQAKANAPTSPRVHLLKDERISPGTLKKSIFVKGIKRTEYTAEAWVTVRPKIWYAKFVEYGTVKMKAESFLRTAFDQEKGFALAKMVDTLRLGIAEQVEKIYGARS